MAEAVMPPKPINLLKSEYKLVGKLGSGGFSFVYLVESLDSGQMCAAKFQVTSRKSKTACRCRDYGASYSNKFQLVLFPQLSSIKRHHIMSDFCSS